MFDDWSILSIGPRPTAARSRRSGGYSSLRKGENKLLVVMTQCFDVGNDQICCMRRANSPPGRIMFSALFCRNSSNFDWATVSMEWQTYLQCRSKCSNGPENVGLPKYAFWDPKMKIFSGEEQNAPSPNPSLYGEGVDGEGTPSHTRNPAPILSGPATTPLFFATSLLDLTP